MSTTTEKWTIFGERLKAELERQGMSLRQFSEKTGITLVTACRYVHSQRTPRATEILKAAKALGTTCDYMLGLSDDPHKTRDGWAKAGFHDLPPAQPETHEERTETHACDCIERQAAIDAVKKNTFRLTFAEEQNCEGHVAWSAEAVYSDVMEGALLELPSAQPDSKELSFTQKKLDTISRQEAVSVIAKWMLEYGGEGEERERNALKQAAEEIKEFPSAQPDMSEYSDKLWKAAYERGKAEAQPDLDEVYAHAETEAEARYHAERKKGKWIYGESEAGNDGYYCSKCGNFVPWKYDEYDIDFIKEFLFCNKCGAEMTEGEG